MFIKEINKGKNIKGGNIIFVVFDKNLLLGSRLIHCNDDAWEETETTYDDMDVVAI